jgi:hypothetical protein
MASAAASHLVEIADPPVPSRTSSIQNKSLGGEFQLLVRPPRASPLQLSSGPGARKGNADCPQDGTDSTTRTVESFSSSQCWHKNASIQQLSCLLAPDVRLVFQLLLCLVVAVSSPVARSLRNFLVAAWTTTRWQSGAYAHARAF